MSSNRKASTSILKGKKGKTSRRNVSFAPPAIAGGTSATAASTTSARKPLSASMEIDNDYEGDRRQKPNRKHTHPQNKEYRRSMNDDEEDAFDPSPSNGNGVGINDSEEKQIRDAKAKRALRRVTAGDFNLEDDNDSTVKKRRNKGIGTGTGRGAMDGFDGEEEVDEQYSLLHDQSLGDGHTQKQNQFGNGSDMDTKQGGNEKEQCPIEPFNMTSEREDGMGYFDGDTYVFRRGKGDDEEDAWLDDLNHQETADPNNNTNAASVSSGGQGQTDHSTSLDSMILSREKGARRERKSAISLDDHLTKEQVYDQILTLLAMDSETVMQALGRYGAIIKREKKSKKTTKRKAKQATQQAEAAAEQDKEQNNGESASMKALNRLTELSSLCMMKFDDGIYDRNKKFLNDFLTRSDQDAAKKRKRSYFDNNGMGNDGKANDDASLAKRSKGMDGIPKGGQGQSETTWEYKGNQDNSIHGPYTTKQMLDWTSAGYFIGEMAVDVRIVGPPNSNAASAAISASVKEENKEEVVNDLLGDLEDSDDDNDNEDGDNNHEGKDKSEDGSGENFAWQRSDKVDFSCYL